MQLASSKRRSSIPAAFFFIDAANQPIGFFESGTDLLRFFCVMNLDLFFAFTQETRVECGRLRPGEVRVDGPVLNLFEGFDFALAFDDQAESDGLHTSGGKTTADFVPK